MVLKFVAGGEVEWQGIDWLTIWLVRRRELLYLTRSGTTLNFTPPPRPYMKHYARSSVRRDPLVSL